MTEPKPEQHATLTPQETVAPGPPRTYGQIVWRQLKRRPSAIVSLIFILVLAVTAAFARFIGGAVPIVWIEDGAVSLPIFAHMTNGEYIAVAALALGLALPVTVRLLRGRTARTGGSPVSQAMLLHGVVLLAVASMLVGFREPVRSYGAYLERAETEADAHGWFPPIAYPRYPGYDEIANKEQPPSWDHPLGTGRLGGDVLMGILYGARTALTIGFVAVGISVMIGVCLGSASGYFGGTIDLVLMRIAEIFMSIPRLILIITILTTISDAGIWAVVVVLGLTGWTGSYRLMRAELLRIRGEDYMTAARALGVPTHRLLLRHGVPNGLAPILVGATFGIAGAVFLEATLAFLGLVTTPSWGSMLNDGRQHLEYWWIWASSGGAIFVTVFAYNLLGEAIRDAVDPKLKI